MRVKSPRPLVFWSRYLKGAWSEDTCWIDPASSARHNASRCSPARIGGLHTNFATSKPPSGS